MSKDPRVYLVHILERIDRILRYTQQGRDTFFRDTMIQDAVVRGLEVMGEAAKRIPNDFRDQHKEIPWRSLSALRDVLIHQYEGVSLERFGESLKASFPVYVMRFATWCQTPNRLNAILPGVLSYAETMNGVALEFTRSAVLMFPQYSLSQKARSKYQEKHLVAPTYEVFPTRMFVSNP